MVIKKYRSTVGNFPVREQGETSKVATWEKYYRFHRGLKKFTRKYGPDGVISLSRGDIFLICQADILEGLFASVVWGYPRGPRGTNFRNVLRNIKTIEQIIYFRKNLPTSEFHKLLEVPGLSISTLSKFLYFFRCQIDGRDCLIFDAVMNDICAGNIFGPDFHPIMGEIKGYINNPKKYYPRYLESMSEISLKLKVSGERLEGFLFLVGRNLKPTN